MKDLEELDLSHDLALALDVADLVDAFTLPHFHEADFTIDWKRIRPRSPRSTAGRRR